MHDGLRIPVPHGTLCEVETKGGDLIVDTSMDTVLPGHASQWIWSTLEEEFWFMAIVRFRFLQPRALLDLIALAADPYMVPPSREVVPA